MGQARSRSGGEQQDRGAPEGDQRVTGGEPRPGDRRRQEDVDRRDTSSMRSRSTACTANPAAGVPSRPNSAARKASVSPCSPPSASTRSRISGLLSRSPAVDATLPSSVPRTSNPTVHPARTPRSWRQARASGDRSRGAATAGPARAAVPHPGHDERRPGGPAPPAHRPRPRAGPAATTAPRRTAAAPAAHPIGDADVSHAGPDVSPTARRPKAAPSARTTTPRAALAVLVSCAATAPAAANPSPQHAHDAPTSGWTCRDDDAAPVRTGTPRSTPKRAGGGRGLSMAGSPEPLAIRSVHRPGRAGSSAARPVVSSPSPGHRPHLNAPFDLDGRGPRDRRRTELQTRTGRDPTCERRISGGGRYQLASRGEQFPGLDAAPGESSAGGLRPREPDGEHSEGHRSRTAHRVPEQGEVSTTGVDPPPEEAAVQHGVRRHDHDVGRQREVEPRTHRAPGHRSDGGDREVADPQERAVQGGGARRTAR